MHHEDRNADNLLLRLFSYTPREKRRQDEDFCTECLAWILRNSSEFREEFLRPIIKTPTSTEWKISTQMHFAGEAESSRFDLVLEPNNKALPIVLIECKVDSQTDPYQIEKYRQHAKTNRDWADRSMKIALLTKESTKEVQKLANVDYRVYWTNIHQICRSIERNYHGTLSDHPIQWFAGILEEKGMNYKEIPTLPESLEAQRNCELLVEAMDEITSRALKSALLEDARRINVKRSITEKGIWRGCRLDMDSDFLKNVWAGFLLRKAEGGVELLRWVEFSINEAQASDLKLAKYIEDHGWREPRRNNRHLYWHSFVGVSSKTPCSESEDWLRSRVVELSQKILPEIQARSKAMASK